MQESTESAESDGNGDSHSGEEVTTVLVEALPGVAIVFGEVPPDLKGDLVEFGLVPAGDRTRISTVLGAVGNTAAVAGNLGSAIAGAQGLYRLSDATQAVLRAGGTLAVKDGANLGAVFLNGRIVHQARLIPAATVTAAGALAAVGPVLAMVALQMQLSEITGFVRTNIALTGQVLREIRNEQWAELTGLVATVDGAIDQARAVETVPASVWEGVAGSKALLLKQRDQYQRNVRGHIEQIDRLGTRARREYLETNAEAIVFDAHALLSSVKAWIGYQALHAARARATGADDAAEAGLVEVLARQTRTELDSALAETRRLVDALTRELRILAELPGRDTLPLPGKRKDAKAARDISASLLSVLEPLADALHPPASPLAVPDVVCAPDSLDPEPYLRILRWFLADDERLEVLAFADPADSPDVVSTIIGGARGMFGAAKEKAPARTMVAVTDRRILVTGTNPFLEEGDVQREIPVDQVRYVRVTTVADKTPRPAIDLITRDENLRWTFPADVDGDHVGAAAAVLAESMTIPESERRELRGRGPASITAG
ncbi:hypothetical protein GCM10025331_66800 [Actinoplanes utahensis]|nr:hypothetical protein Aut01nite_53040 [Actinoplanes utahensis]